MINNELAVRREEEMKTSPQLTLGELILKLEPIVAAQKAKKENDEATVRFDFAYFHPTVLSSWRGSYRELALEFSDEGEAPKVSEFLKKLKEAVGKTYEGYKGGDFVMGKTTPLWVANYGDSNEVGVVGVLDRGWVVILETKFLTYGE